MVLRSTGTVTMARRVSASGVSVIVVTAASLTGAVTVAARGRGSRRFLAASGDHEAGQQRDVAMVSLERSVLRCRFSGHLAAIR
jgi:hypothetical protein